MIETPAQFSLEWWEVFFAGLSTLAIFSFLYRENQFYRFFEHLFIGIATGYGIVAFFQQFLWPQVLKPLFGMDRLQFPDGSWSAPYNEWNLLYLFPMSLGLLYYAILTKRHKWLAQLAIGCQLGAAGGLAFKGFFVEFLPQLFDSFRPLYTPSGFAGSFTNIVFLVTLLCSLAYFFFTLRSSTAPQLSVVRRVTMPAILAACTLAAVAGWLLAPLPGDVKGTEHVFILPLLVSVSFLVVTTKQVRGTLSPQSMAGGAVFLGWFSLFTVLSLILLNYLPVLLTFPHVNMALTITLLALFFFLLQLMGAGTHGMASSATVMGRWLMMGCFGAFFGSTIMARMALLVERLEFLIDQWFPLFL